MLFSSTLILANDPDADRLAVAEKQNNGQWRIFTGNEIGALLAHWQFVNFKGDVNKVAMVASTVSSKLIGAMARTEGFRFEETLTGFKWMGACSNFKGLTSKTNKLCTDTT